MDLTERIARRRRRDESATPIVDYGSLSPAGHPVEPTDRSRVLERLLDVLDPVFRGALPPNAYVHGPHGAGKTAVVRALFEQLSRHVGDVPGRIVTTTRAGASEAPEFVYVDGRHATSEFRLYRAVLASLVDEEVPVGGVKTDEIRDRLVRVLGAPGRSAVIAVDHLDEPRTVDLEELRSIVSPFADDVALLGVGTTRPGELADAPEETLAVDRYERHTLSDILSARASEGLAGAAPSHDQLRGIAAWADGDAHDALAALFGAATLADEEGEDAVSAGDVERAMDAVPADGVPVGMVVALPENRQRILRTLIDLEETGAVGETAALIADRPGVDLSEGTVERFLYELADWGVLERVAVDRADADQGRPPSRVEPRLPTMVFRRLYDLRTGEAE